MQQSDLGFLVCGDGLHSGTEMPLSCIIYHTAERNADALHREYGEYIMRGSYFLCTVLYDVFFSPSVKSLTYCTLFALSIVAFVAPWTTARYS